MAPEFSRYGRLRFGAWRISTFGLPVGPHLTRYSMYRRLESVGRELPKRNGKVLSVSHSENLVGLLGLEPSEVVSVNYPEYNLLDLSIPDSSFDFVLSDQVLEHLEGDPFDAISECHRILKPGGIAVHTTCMMNPIHRVPGDFWRFTPDCLSLLHRDFAKVIEVGGWGNFAALASMRAGMRFLPVPNAKWHPLNRRATDNDPNWPITTWVVAQK